MFNCRKNTSTDFTERELHLLSLIDVLVVLLLSNSQKTAVYPAHG